MHAKTYIPSHWHLWLQNQHGAMVSLVGQPSSQSLCTGKQLQRQHWEGRSRPSEVAAKETEENVKAVLDDKL